MKRIKIFIYITLVTIIAWNYDLLKYGFYQAKGQLNIIWNAQPIEEYLASDAAPDSLKTKVKLIQEIKSFAVDSLGIKTTENYTAIYDQNNNPVLWNVSACPSFQLQPKKWSFPLLGSFSYKGFFELEMAKKEEAILKNEGYDTRIREVSGWSTLGWFKDPILSNMLYRSEGSLANLIIHEMTHGTLYVKDSVTFNENLASFIGHKGALNFLSQKYGPNSEQLVNYTNQMKDKEVFTQYILRGAQSLDSLYQSFSDQMEDTAKLHTKEKMISQIINNLDTLNLNYAKKYQTYFEKNPPNNAYFMGFMRYQSQQDKLEKVYQNEFSRNLKKFLAYWTKKYPTL